MDRCAAATECEIDKEPSFNKTNVKEDIDTKVQELLKFQHNMIERLDEVIKKLENLDL